MTSKLLAHPGRVLLLLLLLALLLRGLNLGGKSLWLDEAFSAFQGQRTGQPLFSYYDPNHPPLYYMLLRLWIPIFGSSEVALRLPSVLIASLNVGLGAWLARRLFAPPLALGATALLALAPLDVWYAQEARMYPLIILGALLMALGLAWGTWAGGLWLFAGLTLGLYAGYLAFPLWIGLSAVWFVGWWQAGRRPGLLLSWLLASAAGWLVYRPWLPYFQDWLFTRLAGHWMILAVRDVLGLAEITVWHLLLVLALAALGLVLGSGLLLALLHRPGSRRWLTVAALLLFATLTLLMPVPRLYSLKRVLVTGWPFVVLLVAWLVAQIGPGRVPQRTVWAALLGISLLASLVNIWLIPKDDWRQASAYITAHQGSADLIWVDPAWNDIPYQYYQPNQAVGLGPLQVLATQAEQAQTIWLVAERYPSQPVPASPSERWLDQNWQLTESTPFFRLEVRRYQR